MLVTLFTAGLVTSGVVAGAGPLAVLSDSTSTGATTTDSGTTSTEPTTTDSETTSEETTAESTTGGSETTETDTTETTTTETTPTPSGPPTITSDKDDYAPGELVTLTGTNWQPGENVKIDVNDDEGQTWRRTVNVVADAAGRITDSFNLPAWFVATYYVTATGDVSGVATTTFTDGTVRVRADGTSGNAAPITWVHFNSTTCTGTVLGSGSISATTGSNGADIPVAVTAAQSLRLTAGAISGFQFSNWNNGNFTTGNPTTANPACLAGTTPTQNTRVAYVVQTDTTAPTVLSINRSGANPTNTTGNVGWAVVFSESVSGVNDADFALANAGLGGSPAIVTVTGSGANYTVTASSGTGSGMLGLNLVDDDSIADTAANKLGGTGAGNGNFTGQVYTIDRTAPTLTAAAVTLPGSAVYLANTWTNKDVQVTFTCSDTGGSGLTGSSGNQVQNFTTETSGTTATFGGICGDNAGNSAAGATFGPIKIDKTDPTLSVTHTANGSNGWNTSSPVSLSIAASDGLSGLAGSPACTDNGDPLPVSGSSSPWSASVSGLSVHDIDCSILDNAGNDQTATDEVKIDTTAPVITPTVSGTLGSNGWYVGDITVTWTAEDPQSGIATSTGCGPTTVSTDTAGLTLTCSATNNAGMSDSESVTVKRDDTDPAVTVNLARDPDHNGWYNHGVGYRAVGSDATSGIAGCDAGAVYDGPDSATASVSLDCTDNAGNEGSGSATFKYDDTAPVANATATPVPNTNGWNKTNVTVTFTGTDVTAGIDFCADPIVLSSDGAGQSASGTCTDNAGNVSASATASGINIDKTMPTVALVGGPADGGSYYFGSVPAAPTCTASDALSGLDGPCTVSGYATTVGQHTVTATATDKAGNSASVSRTYTVLAWSLEGFYQPVDMGTSTWNTVKGGSTVPLKFRVFAGPTELTDTALVTVMKAVQVGCTTGSEDAIEELAPTGGTSLRYGGQFIYNWQTPRLPGKCYKVTIGTADGSSLTANFKLK